MVMDNLTNRWLATLGIGALIFGLALVVLRVPVRTMMIFFAIGIPVVFLWLYADERDRKQKKEIEELSKIQEQPCICSVCKKKKEKEVMIKSFLGGIILKGIRLLENSINQFNKRKLVRNFLNKVEKEFNY